MRQLTPEQMERVRKLVNVLRTTKKKQGRYVLARVLSPYQKEYCCLGIACELAIKEGLPLNREKEPPNWPSDTTKISYTTLDRPKDGAVAVLPHVVRDWYGFRCIDPELIDESGSANFATTLNDVLRYDFKRIADAFERTYLSDDDNNNQ